jgi:hypothetical protein
MPLNFRWVGFILNALPEAKIIHISRDPMAVCWSNYKTHFPASGLSFSNGQLDVTGYYKLYHKLMKFWQSKFPGQIHEIDYDKLTTNLESEIRRLTHYVGLSSQDTMINFHLNSRSVNTASSLQVRNKIYQGSSEEWKKYSAWLNPMIENLGAIVYLK